MRSIKHFFLNWCFFQVLSFLFSRLLIFVDDCCLFAAVLEGNVAYEKGNLIVFVEAVPEHICEAFHIIVNSYLAWFANECWDWVAILFVCMDDSAFASDWRHIFIEISEALCIVAVIALENADDFPGLDRDGDMDIQRTGLVGHQCTEGVFVQRGFAVIEDSHGSLLGNVFIGACQRVLYRINRKKKRENSDRMEKCKK